MSVSAEAGHRGPREVRAGLRMRPGRQHRVLLPPERRALRQDGDAQVGYPFSSIV